MKLKLAAVRPPFNFYFYHTCQTPNPFNGVLNAVRARESTRAAEPAPPLRGPRIGSAGSDCLTITGQIITAAAALIMST